MIQIEKKIGQRVIDQIQNQFGKKTRLSLKARFSILGFLFCFSLGLNLHAMTEDLPLSANESTTDLLASMSVPKEKSLDQTQSQSTEAPTTKKKVMFVDFQLNAAYSEESPDLVRVAFPFFEKAQINWEIAAQIMCEQYFAALEFSLLIEIPVQYGPFINIGLFELAPEDQPPKIIELHQFPRMSSFNKESLLLSPNAESSFGNPFKSIWNCKENIAPSVQKLGSQLE